MSSNPLRKTSLGILILVGLFFSAQTQAQVQCARIHLLSTRTEISNPHLSTNHFRVNRDLEIYDFHFPFKTTALLDQTVRTLPEHSIWVDMGAGEARALIDGLIANPNIAQGIAISYQRPPRTRSADEVEGRFRYLEGDFVENMARDGKLNDFMGRVNLLTDVFGPVSYSEHLPQLLQTYFNLLRPDGLAVFNLMNQRNFEVNDGRWQELLEPKSLNPVLRNGILDHQGVITWLRTIPGIEVVEVAQFKAEDDGAYESSFAIKIRKVADRVIVPTNLRTIEYEAASPPLRRFELVEDRAGPRTRNRPARQ